MKVNLCRVVLLHSHRPVLYYCTDASVVLRSANTLHQCQLEVRGSFKI